MAVCPGHNWIRDIIQKSRLSTGRCAFRPENGPKAAHWDSRGPNPVSVVHNLETEGGKRFRKILGKYSELKNRHIIDQQG